MKTTVLHFLFITASLLVTSCSSIQKYFPDKEKEYQFAREVPHLQIPEDLQHNAVKDKPAYVSKTTAARQQTNPAAASVKYLQFDGGAERLRINAPIEFAWRYVNKALGRHSIEILERNEAEHFIKVNYDPDRKKLQDDSFWDEIVFIFGDDPNQETEMVIRLAETQARATDIIVVQEEDDDETLSRARQLLLLLRTTIHQDLAQ